MFGSILQPGDLQLQKHGHHLQTADDISHGATAVERAACGTSAEVLLLSVLCY